LYGRTPYEALSNYVTPLSEALRCITAERFFILRDSPSGLAAHKEYSFTLNDMNSVSLKGENGVRLIAGQTIHIDDLRSAHASQRFRFRTLAYTYGFTLAHSEREQELLTFHRRHEGGHVDLFPGGHVHIGPALLANPTAIRPGNFHKAHVPTGHLPFAAVVRFAIVELGVAPHARDWCAILRRSEALSAETLAP
jgi:hypothetical protein